ncbi:hypothetical protein [Paenibacillus sp. GCM10027626]|uniref:hypothetical protein n=1 Tax=Paenibacillus sp. GCM10027626 TaxID=3273411 RepID=UPI003644FBEE
MRDWIEAIRGCGLTLIEKHAFDETLVLYETSHRWRDIVLGHYLLIPASLELIADITESVESFRGFEDEIVSPFYFRLRGDWSWNLYIVFVVPDMSGLSAERLSIIQRGKRFGKKLVVTFEQLSEKLPMAKIPERLGGAAAGDPLADWQNQLAPAGLMFCLDDFKTQSLRNYLEDSDHAEDVPLERISSPIPVAKPIGPIAALEFGGEFRPHVLANTPPLRFTQVNLLSGPNGMGKTSVLEGIELAFTGSIQRNLLVDRNGDESWNGSIWFADGDEEPFQGTPNSEEKKQREIAYYKHKVGPRGQSLLNSAFHQYNYFSSEAVHQFCFSQAGKVDYRDAFARVIFGEQLERFEQCWKQYLAEFQRQARSLSKEQGELTADIHNKNNEGIQDSELLQERAHAQLQQIHKWMKHCLLSYPIPDGNASLDEIGQWLQHLKPLLHELDIASAPFMNRVLPEINTIDGLNKQEQAVAASLKDVQIRLSELRQQLARIPDRAGLEQTVQQRWAIFQALREEQDKLAKLSSRLSELSYLVEQRDSRRARLQLHERISSLESAVRLLADADNLYGHLAAHPLMDADISELRTRLDDLEANRLVVQAFVEEAAEQAARLKERTGKLQKLVAELKATAEQVLHLHPDQSECPLCGHDHETAQVLKDAIDSRLQADNNELTQLLTDMEQNKLKLQGIDFDRQKLRHELSRQEQLAAARTYLLNRSDIEETKSLDSSSSLQAVQNVLIRIRQQIGDQTSLLNELRRQAQALDEQGITVSSISELEDLLADPLLASSIHGEQTERQSKELLGTLKQEQDRIAEKVEAARGEYATVQDLAGQAEQNRQALSDQIDNLSQQERQYRLLMNHMDEMRQTCSRLNELNVRLPNRQSWSEWKLYLQKLLLAADELSQVLEPLVLVEQKEREVSDLVSELNEVAVKLERCNRAIHVLSALKSLTEYGDDFVRSNFDAISRLFVALHAPNEFEGLEWTADNKIEARRRGSGAKCAIHQMSTGQRTSVYLAIFFIMHLVMDSAPQFLLLDEPVAHMDELNVLGLLDFLRQLTITRGTQIFFTTANQQIATLFRRKFSFLERKFRVFHLRREVEGPMNIHIQHFTPYQENPVTATT